MNEITQLKLKNLILTIAVTALSCGVVLFLLKKFDISIMGDVAIDTVFFGSFIGMIVYYIKEQEKPIALIIIQKFFGLVKGLATVTLFVPVVGIGCMILVYMFGLMAIALVGIVMCISSAAGFILSIVFQIVDTILSAFGIIIPDSVSKKVIHTCFFLSTVGFFIFMLHTWGLF